MDPQFLHLMSAEKNAVIGFSAALVILMAVANLDWRFCVRF